MTLKSDVHSVRWLTEKKEGVSPSGLTPRERNNWRMLEAWVISHPTSLRPRVALYSKLKCNRKINYDMNDGIHICEFVVTFPLCALQMRVKVVCPFFSSARPGGEMAASIFCNVAMLWYLVSCYEFLSFILHLSSTWYNWPNINMSININNACLTIN